MNPSPQHPDEQPSGFSMSVKPGGLHEALALSLARNEPYEVLAARTSDASGLVDIVARAPRNESYPRVLKDLARAIEEELYRRAPEAEIYRQCNVIVQNHRTCGGLATAEAEEWDRVAVETLGLMAATKDAGERTREEARRGYESLRRELHGLNSEPTLTLEGERIIKEHRDERYWDVCQRLASVRAAMSEKRSLEIYTLASSLEKTDPSQAIDLYSWFLAQQGDLSRLRSYVLGALERMSLLQERSAHFPEALDAITRYEETVAQTSNRGLLVPKRQMMAIQRRKSRLLSALAQRSGQRQ